MNKDSALSEFIPGTRVRFHAEWVKEEDDNFDFDLINGFEGVVYKCTSSPEFPIDVIFDDPLPDIGCDVEFDNGKRGITCGVHELEIIASYRLPDIVASDISVLFSDMRR